MCKSVTEGGARCANHTKGPAYKYLLDHTLTELTHPERQKIQDYAATATGGVHLERNLTTFADTFEEEVVLKEIIRRGKEQRKASSEVEKFLRTQPLSSAQPAVPVKGSVLTTGKTGTGAPPMSIATKTGRYYMLGDIKDKEQYINNPDEALKNGNLVPSVTTCMKNAKDVGALLAWATNVTAAEASRRFVTLSNATPEEREKLLQKWTKRDPSSSDGGTMINTLLKTTREQALDAAAERGTEAHALIEQITQGETPEIPEHLQGYIVGFYAMQDRFAFRYTHSEVTVGNETDGYAGTADGIVQIDGLNFVLDYKSNKTGTIYNDVQMQLSALANAEFILHPDGSRTPMPPIAGGIGVGLAPDGTYSVVPFKTDGVHYEYFKSTVMAWRGKREEGPCGKPTTPEGLVNLFN
jgi:hypothetical protein